MLRAFASLATTSSGEGHAVAGEQRRRDVHLPLRAQAVEAGVQNDGAGAFLVRLGVVLAVGEPAEKFVGVEVEMRRDLRELVEACAVVRLEHVDEVGDEVFVEHQAVAEHLEGVLARVGIGGRLVRLPGGSGRLLRLRRAAERHAREERAGEVLLMEAV